MTEFIELSNCAYYDGFGAIWGKALHFPWQYDSLLLEKTAGQTVRRERTAMKIRLQVSDNRRQSLSEELRALGIDICEDAELTLTDSLSEQGFADFLSVRDSEQNTVRIATGDILFIEAYGHDVEFHCDGQVFFSRDPLYRIMNVLNENEFVRVSNSVIISRKHVKKIRSSYSMKFVLTMTDGTLIDVTRTYYYAFKEFFRI